MIAAIYAAVRTSMTLMDGVDRSICVGLLISCSSPSISQSQPADTADEDRRKPLADAIALAEDALITTLRSTEFQDPNGDSEYKCLTVPFFVDYYQRFALEQLASRASERMLRELGDAVKDLPLSSWVRWDRVSISLLTIRKEDVLEWLKSLEEERNRQIVSSLRRLASHRIKADIILYLMQAADKNERTGTSSKIA